MSEENISVREWQQLFRSGIFSSQKPVVQRIAGWDEWLGGADRLAGRLKNIAGAVMGITDPFILDNYHIVLRNKFSDQYRAEYDVVYFHFQDSDACGKNFHVTMDGPHENRKWTLITERFDHCPEYECDEARDMARYINAMAHGMARELEQDALPAFIAEKNAVMLYALRHDESYNIRIFRNGDHKFSYRSSKDRGIRNVMVSASPEDGPEGFVAEQAEKVKGLYIYCPEEAAVSRDKEKNPRRKEQER